MTIRDFDVCQILREIAGQFVSGNQAVLDRVLLVGIQHILGTTVDMLTVMKEYGLKHAVLGGKHYSTHTGSVKKITELGFKCVEDSTQLGPGRFDDAMQEVVHRVWFKALEMLETCDCDLIIVLDDGADLLRATPGALFNREGVSPKTRKPIRIIGIEQTRGGSNHPLFRGLPFPIINVAGAFVKTHLEYPHVANLVANKVVSLSKKLLNQTTKPHPVIGIMGYGQLGKAIAKAFVEKEFDVLVHDDNKTTWDRAPKIVFHEFATVMIANADIIIGSTGKDVTQNKANLAAFLYSREKKCLLSAGSKDLEFNTLLRMTQKLTKRTNALQDPLQTIQYQNHVGTILEIIRGGFPVNFTNELHSVSPEKIWPTRVALMLACFSAQILKKSYFKAHTSNIDSFMLATAAQTLIIKKYVELCPGERLARSLGKRSASALIQLISQCSDGIILPDLAKDTDKTCVNENGFDGNLLDMAELLPGSVYWKDQAGRYLGCNHIMVKTAGLNSVDDIIGKTDLELWPASAFAIRQNDSKVMSLSSMVFLNEKVSVKNGKLMCFSSVKIPLKDRLGRVIGVVGNSHAIP
jgi:S-adenosylhomocysteine hydrolase